MNPAATRYDFSRQKPDVQRKLLTVLQQLTDLGMACRCEMAGTDFVIVVARGYSSPKFWLSQFSDPDEAAPQLDN